jgi:hypothetical protein
MLTLEADEKYRGGPDNPLSDKELQDKFTDCTQALYNDQARARLFKTIAEFEQLEDVESFISLLYP